MANLTSTIRIAGNIGGRVINFGHTYTLEDVYDVVTVTADQSVGPGSVFNADAAGGISTMPQAGFDYLFFRNNSPQHYGGVKFTNAPAVADFICSPGQFGVMCANATGEFFGVNSVLPPTLIDVDSVSEASVPGSCQGSASFLAAYNAAT